jgi:putative alpha-1,2-mannosidase
MAMIDLGIYPVATQPVYLLLSPRFDYISMKLANGTLVITADRQGGEGFYVQSVKVNGVPWIKSWVSHEDIVGNGGGLIEFVLGVRPVSWDVGNVPPSPGHVS